MVMGKSRLAAGLWLSAIAAVCGADQQGLGGRDRLTQAENGEWRLEVRQANLPKLLDEIAARTGSKIHYTVLPETPVDATCVGSGVKGLLQCLLGSDVDMAFRSAGKTDGVSPLQSEEVWIMGSSLASRQPVSRQCAEVSPAPVSTEESKAEKAEQWLRLAKARDPKQRALALAELASVDAAFDAEARVALQNALSDKNAMVRAQAIGALASREGEAAVGEQLRRALGDGNVDVRLMAVDNIEQDMALLQLATEDAEPAIRIMAEAKLEQLNKQ